MKFFLVTILALLSLKSNAETSNCKEQYATLFRLAAENTLYSKIEVMKRIPTALSYEEAGYGPGPGYFAKKAFLAALDQKNVHDLVGLNRDQVTLRNLLKDSAKCFPGLSKEDIFSTYEMLTK